MELIQKDNLLEEMKINDYLYENTIYMDCEIDRESQIRFCRQLKRLAEKELLKPEEERKHVKIKISSFGGWVVSVFAMCTYMEYWQEQGIIIETYCDGYVCSGGSKLFMCGSKGYRYITRYGSVLIHQPQFFDYGHSTLQEKVNELKYNLKDWEILKSIIKKHTKLTDDEIEGFVNNNLDVTYFPQDCIDKGIADYII